MPKWRADDMVGMHSSADVTSVWHWRRQLRRIICRSFFGLLAALAVSGCSKTFSPTLPGQAKRGVIGIENAADNCMGVHGKYPVGNSEVLEALSKPEIRKDGQEGVRSYTESIIDPWGTPYNYEFPSPKRPDGSRPAIWSNGPNGKYEQGEGDDINNCSNK